MKVLVAVKRVVDYKVQIRVKSDNSGVETQNVKMSVNPPDENAIEEAVKLKEQGIAEETVAISIGDEKSQDVLRTSMAMGIDRSILVCIIINCLFAHQNQIRFFFFYNFT